VLHPDFLYLLNVAVLGPLEPAPSRTLQQALAGVPCLLCGHEVPEEMPPDQIKKKDDKAAKGTLVYMDDIIPNRPSNSRADVVKFVEGSMRPAGMTHHRLHAGAHVCPASDVAGCQNHMWSIAIDPGSCTTGAVRIPTTGHAPLEHHNAKQYFDDIWAQTEHCMGRRITVVSQWQDGFAHYGGTVLEPIQPRGTRCRYLVPHQ